jgi:integrase
MSSPRISVPGFPGVFFRELKSRFKKRPDRCYEFCIQINGQKKWFRAGRASEGVTPAAAGRARLNKLAEKPAAEPVTINRLLDRLQDIKPFTRVTASDVRIHVRPAFGRLTLDELTYADTERIKRDFQSRYSVVTVKKIFGVLRQAVQQAIRDGLHDRLNPFSAAAGFRIEGAVPKCERFLTRDEADRLLDLLKAKPVWHDMAFLSLHTGIRLTELYKLAGHDLQPDGKTAIIQSKCGGKQVLYLTSQAAAVIRARSGAPSDLLFPEARRSVQHFYAIVKRSGLNAGAAGKIHRVWFHTLRHTFASWLAQNGVDLFVIQKLMRHSSVTMTQRYAHLCSSNLTQGLETISLLFPAA